MTVNKKLYLSFWAPFLLCLFWVFAFSFMLFHSKFLKKEDDFLKQTVKLNSFLILKQLNKKLEFLDNNIQQIKKEEKAPFQSPFSKLIVFHQNEIEKVYLADPAYSKKTQSTDPLELISNSDLNTIQTHKLKYQFKKINKNNKSQFLFIKKKAKDRLEIAVFKANSSFFKLPYLKDNNNAFVAVNNKNNIIFYNTQMKKSRIKKLIESFLKTKTPTYITVNNKKQSKKEIYYLQKWESANLYLISQSHSAVSNFMFLKLSKSRGILTLIFILFFFSLLVYWFQFSYIISAYNFLKFSIISFCETRQFPFSQSKNPLLYFYNNRLELLNKQETTFEQKDEVKGKTFQCIIKDELKKLKSQYPNMEIKEDFNSNVKVFGFERFLRTLIHELLLNALEAMGAMEKQPIDLSIEEKENHIVFSVRDYGTTKVSAEKAFQIYYSTKSQLGVGLNLAQSIVQANGGKIKLKSLEKGGVKVTVHLPLKCFLKQ